MKRLSLNPIFQFVFVGALAIILSLGESAAQAQPRGGSRQPNRPPPPRKQPKPVQRDQPKGWVVKFTPPKEGADEDLIGVISFKPGNKDSKMLRFELRKNDGASVMLGGKKLTPEQVPELLSKGLFCTAVWDEVPGEKNMKQLKTFTLDAFEVEAQIEDVQDNHVVLKALPKNGDWPDAQQQQSSAPTAGQTRTETGPKPKKLKLKIVENVSKFTEKDKKTTKDPADFEVGEAVIASLVYGRNDGMIIEMRPPEQGEARTALGRPRPKKKDDSGD